MGEKRVPRDRRLALMLAVPIMAALLGGAIAPAPAAAKAQPAEAVIGAALEYLGRPYKWGAEGPDKLDCSGLIFRAFADAGYLNAVGNARMRAVGYLRWFERRGLATTDESQARRGDLIAYDDGKHIGIYLGRGEVVSALTTSGITVHRIHGISFEYSHVLKVDWSLKGGRRAPVTDDGGRRAPVTDDDRDGEADGASATDQESAADEEAVVGEATGSLNLRTAADPEAEIVGVVSRGSSFTVIGAGHSPSGGLWFNVETETGETGWIWSQFTDVPEGADLDDLATAEAESVGIATGALNLRTEPDPAAEIVGWVAQGSTFKVLGGANSASGWLWLNVETETGETGWVWSYWTEYSLEPGDSSDGNDATEAAEVMDAIEPSEGIDPSKPNEY